MRRKNVKLEWYAIYYEWNYKCLKRENVLGDTIVNAIIDKCVKKKITNYEELRDALKRELMYHYWSKSEWEVIVGDLFYKEPNLDNFEKIDIWYQLEPNLDRISEYVMRELQLDFEVPKK